MANPTKTENQKHTCNVEAHESTRQRLERALPKDHEDRIDGKGFNSFESLQFGYTSPFLCPKE